MDNVESEESQNKSTAAPANDPAAKPAAELKQFAAPANNPDGKPAAEAKQPRKGLGKIVAVQGPVVDIQFDNPNDIPALYDVIEAYTFDKRRVLLQCAEHLNIKVVRTVSLMDTLNLQLNAPCCNTFQPIAIPVGDECFGRVMDTVDRLMQRRQRRFDDSASKWDLI